MLITQTIDSVSLFIFLLFLLYVGFRRKPNSSAVHTAIFHLAQGHGPALA